MATTSTSSATPGFIASFRTLGDSLLAGVQDRLELFTVELQEEKLRLIQTFIWISAAVFTGMMAITFASLTLVYLLGFLVTRTVFPRLKILGSLVRWGPLVFGAVRGISSAAKTRYGSSKSSRTTSSCRR